MAKETYEQALQTIKQELSKRNIDLDADGLLPNPHAKELLRQTKTFIREAQEKNVLDKSGEQLLKELLGTLEQYDAHTTRNKKSIEDLF